MQTKVKPEFIHPPSEVNELPKRHWLRLDVHDDWVRINYSGCEKELAKELFEHLHNQPKLEAAIYEELKIQTAGQYAKE
jgi:hypothetical protein